VDVVYDDVIDWNSSYSQCFVLLSVHFVHYETLCCALLALLWYQMMCRTLDMYKIVRMMTLLLRMNEMQYMNLRLTLSYPSLVSLIDLLRLFGRNPCRCKNDSVALYSH
jgi:hypothetical protein